jgi:hypothetical protein
METGRMICSQQPGKKSKKLIFENIPAPNPTQQIPNGPDDHLTTTNYHHMDMLKKDDCID